FGIVTYTNTEVETWTTFVWHSTELHRRTVTNIWGGGHQIEKKSTDLATEQRDCDSLSLQLGDVHQRLDRRTDFYRSIYTHISVYKGSSTRGTHG
ncbi:hypothetical protein J6590_087197, partial [Homalodisca vitripennis]